VIDALDAAVRNNVAWCSIVCASHGLGGRVDADVWAVERRPPRFYPDAITLQPSATAEGALAIVDASPGCSVKDSFAALDLTPDGFEVLFDASWFVRAPGPPPGAVTPDLRWSVAHDDEDLRTWERAWGDGDDAGLFPPALLERTDVAFMCARRGDAIVAGAIANLGPGDVVGISNVFATADADLNVAWSCALLEIERRWPGRAVVGYERGPGLATARRFGASPLEPLRVWVAP
jgi:hypothetical protein